MALKTQKKINTLSKKLNIERCKPSNIAIPTDIIILAKNKSKEIENAIKKHGPGVLTKLRRDKDKENDVKELIKAISNPYKTLCFYEYYFKGTSNFKIIDQIFEKVRKEIEKAANRSNKFKKAFESNEIVYDKNNLPQTYKENPDEDDNTAFEMLKMKNGTNVQSFAHYCAEIINMGFDAYENAHNEFKNTKSNLSKELENQNSDYYDGLKDTCSDLNKIFKNNIIPISDQIKELIDMANTKNSILQLKLFKASHSKFLPDLITAKIKLDTNIKQFNSKINILTSNKYGSYSNYVLKGNNAIDDLYYSTKNLYNDLSLNNVDYNDIQNKLDKIIEKTDKINNSVKEMSDDAKNKYKNEMKENGIKFKATLNKINQETIELTNKSIDSQKQIRYVIYEIKKFQESYSAKGWVKWLAKGGIKSLFGGLRKLNEIILNLGRYMEAADMFFPEDEPEPK